MILSMPSTVRPQQRDHRLRDLVYRTGDVTLATNLVVPRSTARGWLGAPATVVVSLDVAVRTDTELRQGDRLAPAMRPEARGTASARARCTTSLRIHLIARAAARRPRQAAAPARHRSSPHVHSAAGAPADRSAVAERFHACQRARHVCPRRPVVLSAHVSAPPDVS